jgi:transposase InsO family protein
MMGSQRRAPGRLDPRATTQWRYEQIAEALGPTAHDVRGEVVARICSVPVRWPTGATRRLSRATVYRWLAFYEQGGLAALRPRRRKDRGAKRARLPKDVVVRARAILVDDPDISFTLLAALLAADPTLKLRARGIRVSRSTLQRRLAADPLYARLQRGRRLARRRTRFVARAPHDIWHLDAKGPITISLRGRQPLVFHVLTVLDDASRATLASLIVLAPDLCAAVRVFRIAAERWGLPGRIYADRASIFDSHAFRAGLADLGAHRIWVKARNPEANGKIEAFHRVLVLWFVRRLRGQVVIDLVHLQQLLDGVLETVYLEHRHRSLKESPRAALADRSSPRAVSRERLVDAFRQRRTLKAHPKTGEVEIGDKTFLVPAELRGRLVFLVDPDPAVPPLVVEPRSEHPLPVERAQIRSADLPPAAPGDRGISRCSTTRGRASAGRSPRLGSGCPRCMRCSRRPLAARCHAPTPRPRAFTTCIARSVPWRGARPKPRSLTSPVASARAAPSTSISTRSSTTSPITEDPHETLCDSCSESGAIA